MANTNHPGTIIPYPPVPGAPVGIGTFGVEHRYTASGPFSNHASLATGLVSYWKLDETSGTRYDSVVASANDLTDNNTVTSAAGMRNNAASFVAANSESLSVASSVTPAGPTAPWSMSGWSYIPSTVAAYGTIATGGDTGVDPGGWALYAKAPALVTTVQLLARNGGDSLTATGIVADAWNHIYVEFAPTPSVSANNGALVTGVGGRGNNDTQFALGKSLAGNYFSGSIDEVGIWSRVLTAQERTDLYNAGAGLFY